MHRQRRQSSSPNWNETESRNRNETEKRTTSPNAGNYNRRSWKTLGRKNKSKQRVVLTKVDQNNATQQKLMQTSSRKTTPEPMIGGSISSFRAVLAMQANRNVEKSFKGSFRVAHQRINTIFHEYDIDGNGTLNVNETQQALSKIVGSEVTVEQVLILLEEFDKDGNGNIDMSEFVMMTSMIEESKKGDNIHDFGKQLVNVVAMSKATTDALLAKISTSIYPARNILCVQGKLTPDPHKKSNHCDDFEPAFAPSDMRCLALVSHNEMKATMKEFVIAHQHILKKFRLTGTNSTMTMLREVFNGDSAVVFGPSCQSGPLGGDAELVALMCSGRLGGMLFFQDPMSAHPHQSDIDCLLRQALVHNTMVVTTPCSAYMMMHTLRSALQGEGKPELIPSFFFTLQSPAVAAYKAMQKKVIQNHSNA